MKTVTVAISNVYSYSRMLLLQAWVCMSILLPMFSSYEYNQYNAFEKNFPQLSVCPSFDTI